MTCACLLLGTKHLAALQRWQISNELWVIISKRVYIICNDQVPLFSLVKKKKRPIIALERNYMGCLSFILFSFGWIFKSESRGEGKSALLPDQKSSRKRLEIKSKTAYYSSICVLLNAYLAGSLWTVATARPCTQSDGLPILGLRFCCLRHLLSIVRDVEKCGRNVDGLQTLLGFGLITPSLFLSFIPPITPRHPSVRSRPRRSAGQLLWQLSGCLWLSIAWLSFRSSAVDGL